MSIDIRKVINVFEPAVTQNPDTQKLTEDTPTMIARSALAGVATYATTRIAFPKLPSGLALAAGAFASCASFAIDLIRAHNAIEK